MNDAKPIDAYFVTAEELRQFVERFEQLESEKQDVAEARGAPAGVLNSPEEKKALRDARTQAAAAQQMMAMAAQGAAVAKDAASAGAMMAPGQGGVA